MNDRQVTTVGANIEYTPDERRLVTTVGANIEYTPNIRRQIATVGANAEFIPNKRRLVASVGAMVELTKHPPTAPSDCFFCWIGGIFTKNPIELQTGEKVEEATDLVVNTANRQLTFKRTYRQTKQSMYQFMGLGWTHNHAAQLTLPTVPSGTVRRILIYTPNFGELYLTETGVSSNVYVADPGSTATVIYNGGLSQYVLTALDKSTYYFNTSGQLVKITWFTGEEWNYTYASGKLSSIADDYGRSLQFEYINNPGQFDDEQLWRLGDHTASGLSGGSPTGRYVEFGYTPQKSNGSTVGSPLALLNTIQDVRGNMWEYDYYGQHVGETDTNQLDFLTERISPAVDISGSGTMQSIQLEQVTYTATTGKKVTAITQERGDSLLVADYTFPTTLQPYTTEVQAGKEQRYFFTNGLHTGAQDAAGNTSAQDFNYKYRPNYQQDARGNKTQLFWINDGQNLESVTDALGNLTQFTYDSQARLQSSIDADNCKTTYAYDATLRQPIMVIVSDEASEIDLNGSMELNSGWANVGSPSVNQRIAAPSGQVDTGIYSRKVIAGASDGIESTTWNLTANHTYLVVARVYIVSGAVKMTASGTAGFDQSAGTTGAWLTLRALYTPTSALANNKLRFVADGGSAEFYVDSVHVLDVVNLLRWQEFRYDGASRTILEATLDPADGSLVAQTTRSYYTTGDGEGLLQTVTQTDVGGVNDKSTTFTYDAAGRVIKTQQTNMFGSCEKAFTLYDEAGNVIASICNYENMGAAPTTVMDAIALFDPATPDVNKVITHVYDALGRRIQTTTDAGASYALTSLTVYDSLDRVIRSITNYDPTLAPTDPYLAPQTAFQHGWDNTRNLVTDTAYNQRGMVRKQVDVLGHVTLYGYDDAGRVVKTIQSASQPDYDNDYGATGDPELRYYFVSSAPDLDLVTSSVYDPAGNLIRAIDTLGNVTFTVYDALNRPIKMVRSVSQPNYPVESDPMLIGYVYSTDADMDLVETTDYDAMGRVRRTCDTLGSYTLYGYDSLGRQVKVIRSASQPNYNTVLDPVLTNYIVSTAPDLDIVTETAYDTDGRVMYTTDVLGRRTWTGYDGFGRAVRTVVNATGTATDGGVADPRSEAYQPVLNQADKDLVSRTTYDFDGRVLWTEDPSGRRTWPVYDAVSRQIRTVMNATGRSTDLSPTDPRSEAYLASADADKDIITHTIYDAQGRVQDTIDPLGQRTRYFYDVLGRRVQTVANYVTGVHNTELPDQDLVSTTIYDVAGRVVRAIDAHSTETEFAYDRAGRRLTVTQAANTTLATMSYTCYDKSGRVLRTFQNWVVLDPDQPTPDAKDENGDFLFVPTTHGTNNDINLVMNYTFDRLGRQLSVSDPLDNQTSMTYFKDGQVQSMTDAGGTITHYRYDRLRRRVTVVQGYQAAATDPADWVWDAGDGRWEDGV